MIRARVLLFAILLGSLAVIAGCQTTASFFQGKQVLQEEAVELRKAADEGTWETFDLKIRYRVSLDHGLMGISGKADFSHHYKYNYELLYDLNLYLLLLDAEYRVVETRRVRFVPPLDIESSFLFEEQLNVPPDIAAFSFAYDGSAREGARDGWGGSSFWHHPK